MNAVMNMGVEIPFKVCVVSSLRYTLQVDLLSYMVMLGLIPREKSTVFLIMTAPFYTPMNNALTNTYVFMVLLCVLIETILMNMNWYSVVLISISLIQWYYT